MSSLVSEHVQQTTFVIGGINDIVFLFLSVTKVSQQFFNLPINFWEHSHHTDYISRATKNSGREKINSLTNFQDECSFVSLRDVERVMNVMVWFSQQERLFTMMHEKVQKDLQEEAREIADYEEGEEEEDMFADYQVSYDC